jgi:periplasmic copper chaperone A
MTNRGWPKVLGLLAGIMFIQSVAWADGSISIENPWVRDAPPHAEMSAGYLTILNHSGKTQTLTSVSSPQFQKVEAHKTVMVNGQVRMLREDKVTVPAHGSVEFKPGGYHLMLIHPLHELKLGDRVEIHLQFKGTQPLTVDAQIREAAEEMPPHGMHKMHDMNM